MMTLEGVEAMMLSLIYCPQSRFFVHNSFSFDRILNLKIALQSAASCYQRHAICSSKLVSNCSGQAAESIVIFKLKIRSKLIEV